ncbi:LolA family protein [Kitasatospora mediocidica]|uniref:LolA family protein n=1 Tax=Kitasatospora mediocidica TaxID=58352 RepID=UPI0007C806BF|nr:outer membrane lipoprotein carrier protein LolA [Kitasatospora mediocidica]
MTEYAGFEGEKNGEVYRSRRRAALRLLVPVAVAAVAVAGVNLVPALASDGSPTLPQLTAEQLIGKALGSDTQQLSGTVQVSADLGIPSELLSLTGHGGAAAAVTGTAGAAGGSGQAKEANGSAASPESRLTALLAGSHTLRVAVDGPDKQRIALVESLAEYDVIHNGDQLWAWDSSSNSALHLSAPQGAEAKHPSSAPLTGLPTTPQEVARQFLAQSAASSTVAVSGTATVAGRSAYELSLKPKQTGSTIGEVRIAVDSATGTPLAVVATGTSGNTILDVHFSDVSLGQPAAKTFTFTPPPGATVTDQRAGQKAAVGGAAKPQNSPKDTPKGQRAPLDKAAPQLIGSDWTTVLSFHLPSDEGSAAVTGTAQGAKGRKLSGLSASSLVKSLGKPVAGGELISTKVLNILVTDDGRVYAGAVTLPVLQTAAGVK